MKEVRTIGLRKVPPSLGCETCRNNILSIRQVGSFHSRKKA
jgi:hypothetical protein